jgi:hypothetical protein
MPRPLIIDTTRNLPPRARAAGGSELQKIFGGCASRGSRCQVHADCCGDDPCAFDLPTGKWKCVEACHSGSGGSSSGSGGGGNFQYS